MRTLLQSEHHSEGEGGGGDHLDGRREIFSSESRRSFEPKTDQPAAEAKQAKPKRNTAEDETTTAKDETEPAHKGSSSAPEPTPPSAKKSDGDEPPPTLDKSVDEGPL